MFGIFFVLFSFDFHTTVLSAFYLELTHLDCSSVLGNISSTPFYNFGLLQVRSQTVVDFLFEFSYIQPMCLH